MSDLFNQIRRLRPDYANVPDRDIARALGLSYEEPEQSDTLVGFKHGAKSLLQTGAGAVGLLGDTLGADSVRDWGLQKYQSIGADMQPEQRSQYNWEGVHNAGDLADFAQYWGGYGASNMLGGLGSGAVGAALAKRFGRGLIEKEIAETAAARLAEAGVEAKAKGAVLDAIGEKAIKDKAAADVVGKYVQRGFMAGVAPQAFGQELGATYGQAVDEAVKGGGTVNDVDLGKVWGYGSLAGAAEFGVDLLTAGAAKIGPAKGLFKRADNFSMLPRVGLKGFATSQGEGFTEMLQTGLEDLGSGKTWEQANFSDPTSYFAGAIPGGIVGSVGGITPQHEPQTHGQVTSAAIEQAQARLAEQQRLAQEQQAQQQAEEELQRKVDLRMQYQPEYTSKKDFIKQRVDAILADEMSGGKFRELYDAHRREALTQGVEPDTEDAFKKKLAKQLSSENKDRLESEWVDSLDRYAETQEQRRQQEEAIAQQRRQQEEAYRKRGLGYSSLESQNQDYIDAVMGRTGSIVGPDGKRHAVEVPPTALPADYAQNNQTYRGLSNPTVTPYTRVPTAGIERAPQASAVATSSYDIHQEAINAGVPISGYGQMEARNVGSRVDRSTVEGFTPRGAVLTDNNLDATRMEEATQQKTNAADSGKLPIQRAESKQTVTPKQARKKVNSAANSGYLTPSKKKELLALSQRNPQAAIDAVRSIVEEDNNAVQKQSAGEGVLRSQEPQMGLQEVGEGNAQPQGAAGESETGQTQEVVAASGPVLPPKGTTVTLKGRGKNAGTKNLDMHQMVRDYMGWDENGVPDEQKQPMSFDQLSEAYGISHATARNKLKERGFTEEFKSGELDKQLSETVADVADTQEEAGAEDTTKHLSDEERDIGDGEDSRDGNLGASVIKNVGGSGSDIAAGSGWQALAAKNVDFHDKRWTEDRLMAAYTALSADKEHNAQALRQIEGEVRRRAAIAEGTRDAGQEEWENNPATKGVLWKNDAGEHDAATGLGPKQRASFKKQLDRLEETGDQERFDAEVEALVDRVKSGVSYSIGSEAQGQEKSVLERRLRKLFLSPYFFNRAVGIVQDEAELARVAPDIGKDVQSSEGRTQGIYDPKTNKVWLLANNIPEGRELAVLLHEVGVHMGLRNLLGKANYEALITQLQAWMADGKLGGNSKEAVLALRAYERVVNAEKKLGKKLGQEQFNEELMAYFVEEAVNAGIDPTAVKGNTKLEQWFRRLWAAVKVAIRKLRMNPEALTAQHVVDMAYGAARMELNATWHGTAAEFRRFNHDYMGTGEGAQAFGWGTYLAQRVGIGKGYWKADVRRKSIGGTQFIGNPADKIPYIQQLMDRGLAFASAKATYLAEIKAKLHPEFGALHHVNYTFTKSMERVARAKEEDYVPPTSGSLMRVDTNIQDDELLDWDKPLSEQPYVLEQLKALQRIAAAEDDHWDADHYNWEQQTGKDLIGKPTKFGLLPVMIREGVVPGTNRSDPYKAASEYLDSIGIKGIKFLDQGSRAVTKETERRVAELKHKVGRIRAEMQNESSYKKGTVQYEGAVRNNQQRANEIASLERYIQDEEAKLGQSTRNLVVFNDKNIHRIFSERGANPESRMFSIADTQRQVPEARRVTGVVREVVTNKAKNKLLPSMMFAHHLAEYASKLLPHAATFFKERAERLALKNAMEEKIADYARTFYAFDDNTQRALNKFLKESTESQKWAYKPAWMPNAKVDTEMAKQFDALSPEAQEFAKSIFQYGHDALKHREEAVNATIIAGLTEMRDAARKEGDTRQADKYQRQIDETIRSKGKTLQGIEGPYVPLKRFGNWVVALKSPEYVAADEAGDTKKMAELEKDEAHYYVDFEESEYAANKRAKELQSKNPGKTVQHFERMFDNEEHQEMPYQILRRLQARVDDVLGNGKSEKAVRNLVNQLYISTLNSTHARKSEIRRRTIAGANEDMMRSFITQGRADANLIASLFTHAKLVSNLESIKQDAKKSGAKRAEASSLLNVILKSHNADMQYRPTPWQNNILKANGLWFLLTSPAYYFQNATQPFLYTAPVLAARYGQRASWNEVFDAYKDVGASIKFASNRAFDVTQVQEKVGGEREMAQELINRRHLDVGLSTELGDYLTPAQTTAGRHVDNAIHKLKMVNQHVEFANRLSSALAAYRLKYAELINDNKTDAEARAAAIEYADEIVLDTQGDFSAENAPVWMKQGDKRFPMKLAVQFKKFQFIQLSLIGKLANQAFRDSSATERAIGRRALTYIITNTAMVAGLKGMPILGSVAALAFGMAGDDGEDWETTAKRGIGDKDIARLLLHGVPAAAGIDLSNKLGWQNTLNPFSFVDTGKTSQDAIRNATLSMLLGPTGSQLTKAGAAYDLMGRGDYYKGLEKLMPRGLSDAMKGLRNSFEGVTQYNGDVVLSPDEVGVLRGLFQAAGLPTTLVTERDEMNRAVHNVTEHFKEESATIKHQYAKAAKARDTGAMRALRDDWMAMTASMKRQGLKPPALSTLIKAPQEQTKREKSVRSGVEYTKNTADLVSQLDM